MPELWAAFFLTESWQNSLQSSAYRQLYRVLPGLQNVTTFTDQNRAGLMCCNVDEWMSGHAKCTS